MAAQALLAEEQRKELNFDDASTDAGSELSELPGGNRCSNPQKDAEKATLTEGKTLHFPIFFW